MEFDNSFEVPLPPAEAWKVLLDIKRIAPCMPGAELTEVLDQDTYKGKIGVRPGPGALTLSGLVKVEHKGAAASGPRLGCAPTAAALACRRLRRRRGAGGQADFGAGADRESGRELDRRLFSPAVAATP